MTGLETMMKYANALLARLGLHANDDKATDTFDLRLRRIEAREAKRAVRQVVFKSRSTPQAA